MKMTGFISSCFMLLLAFTTGTYIKHKDRPPLAVLYRTSVIAKCFTSNIILSTRHFNQVNFSKSDFMTTLGLKSSDIMPHKAKFNSSIKVLSEKQNLLSRKIHTLRLAIYHSARSNMRRKRSILGRG